MIRKHAALAAMAVIAASAPAHAAVVISTAATQNMNCSGGTCVPTAANAVLNAGDLQGFLSEFGHLEVTTTGSGVEANDIVVKAPFSTPDTTSLTLDAHKAITINAAVSIGPVPAELELQSGKGGALGTLTFGRKGNITFSSLSDIFGINGVIFTLVGSVQGLASAVAANPSGAFALANSYDASQDGTYTTSPISTTFDGTFEGDGNAISNLTIDDRSKLPMSPLGLFAGLGKGGTIRDIALSNVSVTVIKTAGIDCCRFVGALVGDNFGSILGDETSGTIDSARDGSGNEMGGLVGQNESTGVVSRSRAATSIPDGSIASGGLVAMNYGKIVQSFATGSVSSFQPGGLVSWNFGTINESYATGTAFATSYYSTVGGLISENAGTVAQSYSTGAVSSDEWSGGLIGNDNSEPGSLTNTYWDTDTSGITDLSQGAGAPPNDPGITGLSTVQFQSGLPTGFDPKIWAENPNINNGLPYLIANPPPK